MDTQKVWVIIGVLIVVAVLLCAGCGVVLWCGLASHVDKQGNPVATSSSSKFVESELRPRRNSMRRSTVSEGRDVDEGISMLHLPKKMKSSETEITLTQDDDKEDRKLISYNSMEGDARKEEVIVVVLEESAGESSSSNGCKNVHNENEQKRANQEIHENKPSEESERGKENPENTENVDGKTFTMPPNPIKTVYILPTIAQNKPVQVSPNMLSQVNVPNSINDDAAPSERSMSVEL